MTPTDRVWGLRRELAGWGTHVRLIRTDERNADPARTHEVADIAFALARSLAKHVAVPWAIELTVADILELARRVADPTVDP